MKTKLHNWFSILWVPFLFMFLIGIIKLSEGRI